MNVYISLPITGHDIEQVEASCIYASAVLKKKGHTPVSPLALDHQDPEFYEAVIGTDITALLCCDAVLFMDGWETSKGCRLEHAAAEIYGKEIWYDEELKVENTCIYHGNVIYLRRKSKTGIYELE